MSIKVGISVLLALCMLPACSSASDSGSAGASGGPLVPESTGWTRVASVVSAQPLGSDHDAFAIATYDLQVEAEGARVLYSVDTLIPPAQQTDSPFLSKYFKTRTTFGGAPAPALVVAQVESLQPNANIVRSARRPVFRKASDEVETLLFYKNVSEPYFHFVLFDEMSRQTTMQAMYFDASSESKVLPNEDILAGDINGSFIGELDQYHRASNSWTYVNQSASDAQWLVAYTPFELDDGSALAFRLYGEGAKAYLSIADFTPASMLAPYTARFTEEHPEYARSGVDGVRPVYAAATSVGAYATDGKGVTVVLPTKTKAGTYSISAYSWTSGETAFERLYDDVPVSSALGAQLVTGRDRVLCDMAGTVSAIVLEGHTYRVAVAGASGEKSLGAVSDGDGGDYGPTLSQLRSFAGAYYAIVGLSLGTRTYQGQFLDVVKLVP